MDVYSDNHIKRTNPWRGQTVVLLNVEPGVAYSYHHATMRFLKPTNSILQYYLRII
jgi:hypothetical protein